MASELTRLTIWGLDNLLSIESIPLLLGKVYNQPIEFLQDEPIDEREKTYYNQWHSPDGFQAINIQTRLIIESEINFVHALAAYEFGYGERRSFVNGALLQRDVRVFPYKCPVIFFEFEQKVYCVVEISESQESRLRSHLFGQKRGAKMEEWGDITAKKPLPFQFDSRFYYWLLSKKGQTLTLRGQEVNLLDVSALSLLSEKSVYNSSSEGPALLDGSLPALSSLSLNESITVVGLKIKINNTTLQIKFGKDGVSYVDESHCYKLEQNENMITYTDDCNYFVLLIYGFIFPELLKRYDEDLTLGSWNLQDEAVQRKHWAIKVIKQLVMSNSIEQSEIRDCFESDEGVTIN
ncbi:hypothetical protein [Peribacillus simplex]|uniref:hypothetical protein n=1 Tax=Peribacillus simplex TaxID=1478 RepID=UPI00285340E5|nr:hypothetical protein [Peribacillus simplex]MDR4927234.1 hypothetical protein [Peribacillus simplex]